MVFLLTWPTPSVLAWEVILVATLVLQSPHRWLTAPLFSELQGPIAPLLR